MLDTNIISDLIRNPQGRAAKRIAKGGEDKHHRPRTTAEWISRQPGGRRLTFQLCSVLTFAKTN
jgi:hypothetical protein